jgi:prepilin-type N-terminal cleavage/methylation domain-containing protein
MKLKKTAFTLIEITAGIVILSVLAILAINGYKQVLEKQYYQEARQTLIAIHSAAKMHHAKYNTFLLSPASGGSEQINAALGLNIRDNPYYTYTFGSSANVMTARANRTLTFSFWLTSTVSETSEINQTNPRCLRIWKDCPGP